MKALAKNLYFLRKQAGITQAEIPDNIGIGRGTWSNYELDKTEPDIQTLIDISRFFRISIDQLLTEDLEEKGNLIEKKDDGENGNLKGNRIGNPNIKKTQFYRSGEKATPSDTEQVFKDQLITLLKENIESLKQANSALSSLTEAQKVTITTLESQLTEIKKKTGQS